jgi:acyl-CoA reductase-like NAD-dependent aldehyde dehydrogenase
MWGAFRSLYDINTPQTGCDTRVTMATVEKPTSTRRATLAGDRIEVENPATGEIVGSVPAMSDADVAEMAARARAAQPAWEALGYEGREVFFRRAQKWFVEHRQRVIDTVVAETGKTHEDAQLPEVIYVADALAFWPKAARTYLADERISPHSPLMFGRRMTLRYRPMGVVGVIGPWNFPLVNGFGDCIPALAAGNTVILKPSQVTPLSSLLAAECLREVGVPDGVFQVATGGGGTGATLIDHVDFVMFTGSTETGRKVMERAAKTLTPVSLELGGKDPMIVLADADVERAANAATYYSMNNGGQVCISVERVYVEEPIHDEFVERVVEKVRALRQGPPAGPGSVDVGAVIFPPQVDLIEEHVRDAVAKGATVRVGGHARTIGGGRFFEPTVMTGVDHTMKAMTEETFGPTLPIMRVRDAEEAVRLANDSPFGLAASVWTRDGDRGERIARRIEAGAVAVNDAQYFYGALELPMGGFKTSGIGARHGAYGIRKYCRQQSISVNRFPLKRDPHMFPYTSRVTKGIGLGVKLLFGRGKRR